MGSMLKSVDCIECSRNKTVVFVFALPVDDDEVSMSSLHAVESSVCERERDRPLLNVEGEESGACEKAKLALLS